MSNYLFLLIVLLELLFSFPPEYPKVGPVVKILSSENLEDCDELEILDELDDVIQDNLGLVMIFTLVTYAIEWINSLKDKKQQERIEAEERRKREELEREQHKFEGTRVTVESFINWKLKFDEEMLALKKLAKLNTTNKLTGKEMFMQDKNLANSDLNFENADDHDDDDEANVQVDESLFQDEELLDDEDV